ncbi:MAG TPA: hypothetical protein VL749_02585 [Patescibacteria group bacterium]|jgi:hypothetical protein|nr:hypothetical protein [Patescibacteria group bacterium]
MGIPGSSGSTQIPGMTKRFVAGAFWFLAFGYLFQFAGAMYGFPPALGTVLALGIGVFMGVDPFGVLWKRQSIRRIARIPDASVPADGKRAGIPGL